MPQPMGTWIKPNKTCIQKPSLKPPSLWFRSTPDRNPSSPPMRGAARGRWAARWPSADVHSEGWSPKSGSVCACPRWPALMTASGWWAPARRPQPCAGCYSPWTGSRASSRIGATGAGCWCGSLQRKHEGSSDTGCRVKTVHLYGWRSL